VRASSFARPESRSQTVTILSYSFVQKSERIFNFFSDRGELYALGKRNSYNWHRMYALNRFSSYETKKYFPFMMGGFRQSQCGQTCSRSHKLVILLLVNSCNWFGARGIVSVVCSIVLSKGFKPFMWDLTRAATRPNVVGVPFS